MLRPSLSLIALVLTEGLYESTCHQSGDVTLANASPAGSVAAASRDA
jgi:hypothetical protein